MIDLSDIRDAAAGLRGVAMRTPLVRVEDLGVWLKLENLQPIGAFKIRGAYTAIRRLPPAVRQRGVITYSSGNHGQAVAFAAKKLGLRAVVVMPETAPGVKVDGVKRWGGEAVFAGRTSDDRQKKAEAIAADEGLAIVPPFDHKDIVAGQATVAIEILEELPDVETIVVPVGGAGLVSGVVAGIGASGSRATVWGVEPTGAPKLTRSLEAGKPVRLPSTRSVADGLITLTVGRIPFDTLQRYRATLGGVILVDDDSLMDAVHYLYRQCRLAIEPSGAATTAAVRTGQLKPSGPTVLVVSGGNVDPSLLKD